MHIRLNDDDRSIAGSSVSLFLNTVVSGDVSIHVSNNVLNKIVNCNVFPPRGRASFTEINDFSNIFTSIFLIFSSRFFLQN